MACSNARDTITQAAGFALPNHQDYPDPNGFITVSSYCRTADGTWIAWKTTAGAELGGTTGDTNKADWPENIASALVIGVGFFPDDDSGPIVYELGVDAAYTWVKTPIPGDRDPCSRFPFAGDYYADIGSTQLTAWFMAILDVQVCTDGSNVWVVALARESVKYPFLYNAASEIDECGNTHQTFEEDWADGHSDPFFHDSDAGNRWWLYGHGLLGGDEPFGAYDDPGHDQSFRWQPARVTVWAGDIGGFTMLDMIDAKFDNYDGAGALVSGIEAAASPAEPGVLHVLWSEGGNFGTQTVDPMRGQRVNYSRWDTSGKTLDTDLLYNDETGSGYISDANWVWTAEMILRNDHGAPIAIVWPWIAADGPQYPSTAAEFWDLSSGSRDVVQTLDASLVPTSGETGLPDPIEVYGGLFDQQTLSSFGTSFGTPQRSQLASSLYTDPTLADQDVYLICVGYFGRGSNSEPGGSANQEKPTVAFYRVPVDGSGPFEFLDGVRQVDFSIVNNLDLGFASDFVSDPDNVWMPAANGDVLHLPRPCGRSWESLSGFPSGAAAWDLATAPPAIFTDDEGDWLAGAGIVPNAFSATGTTEIAAIRAKICRCCVPCQALGVRLWKRV